MRDGARSSCMRNEQKGGRATGRERAKSTHDAVVGKEQIK